MRSRFRAISLALLGFSLVALLGVACSSSEDDLAGAGDSPTLEQGEPSAPVTEVAGESTATEPDPDRPAYLTFNQGWLEGLDSREIDPTDADSLFTAVFSGLPDEVTVYPSENYYYFILGVEGRQIWGNIRLPAGRRENGVLSFGFFESIEFPTGSEEAISGSKFFTDADGVIVTEVDRFTYSVRFRGKTVLFHFYELDQTTPPAIPLAEDEVFVQRTFDESGYRFYLLFNERANYFLWVLNEEEGLPDIFTPLVDDLEFGRRSGFAFYIDRAHGDRKILAGVRQLNLRRNDYYDGPFDQLADNYADETGVAELMQRAFPGLRGRIDKYGYYTDQERPLRVAISAYFVYIAQSDMLTFLAQLRAADDPYAFISSAGRVTGTE